MQCHNSPHESQQATSESDFKDFRNFKAQDFKAQDFKAQDFRTQPHARQYVNDKSWKKQIKSVANIGRVPLWKQRELRLLMIKLFDNLFSWVFDK